MPCLSHGKTKLKPGPRKKHPMMTSTAHIIRNIVIIVMANLRSSGLFDGFLSMYGVIASRPSAMPGKQHARDHRVEHLQQLLQTEEVPRRLRRVRRLVDVGEAEQRRLHQRREDGDERRQREDRRELDHEQVRPDVHLVLGLGARLLDRTGLDDGQQALRVTAGTGARRRRRGDRGRGARRATGRRGRGLAAATAGERGLALARTLEQVRGNAALVFGDRVAGVGRGGRRLLRRVRRRRPRRRRELRPASSRRRRRRPRRGDRAPCGARGCA